MIIHEAAETFIAVYHALIAWLIFLAVAASMIAGAAVACFAPGTQAAREDTAAPSWARGHVRARIFTRTRARRPRRRTAPWVHTQPLDYEEAA